MRLRRLLSLVVAATALYAVPCGADEVQLKNGDRLTGTVVSLDAGTLKFKTAHGDLSIAWPEVTALTIDEPILIRSADGKVTTHSGGDTSNAYQKGLHYNATLKAAKLQSDRGWRTELDYEDRTGRLTLKVLDRSAAPITGLHVAASLERPATERNDHKVALKELGEGVYAATIGLAPGAWVVAIVSRPGAKGGGSTYRLKQRLKVGETP